MQPLDILFEDPHVLAINKPSGLATQAPAQFDSLQRRVRTYLEAANSAGEAASRLYLGVPHRLDRPVSGVIVFAKTLKAARKLSKQFERRLVKKFYWAAVAGTVAPAEGTWTDTLRKVPDEPRVEIVAADHSEGQTAILHYRTLGRTADGSVLEIELETGRMHQIRVQAASRGWPILGDAQYGSKLEFGPPSEDLRHRAIALHARSLSIMPPGHSAEITITAPPPANLWAPSI